MIRSSHHFEHVRELGKGTYGFADVVRHLQSGREFVRKRARTTAGDCASQIEWYDCNSEDDGEEDCGYSPVVLREISALASLRHPNILPLQGVSVDKPGQPELYTTKFETDLASWMYQKYHQEDVSHIAVSDVQHIMRQLMAGLHYLHERCYIHRDLKPGNIFLNTTSLAHTGQEIASVVIGDLGLSRFVAAPVEVGQCLTPSVQTLGYRSIELLLGKNIEYDSAIDIFSVGCIFLELLCGGERLFDGRTEIENIFQIFQLMGTPNEVTWPGISSQMANFHPHIFPAWAAVPFRNQARFHTQLNVYGPDVLDLVQSCLELDPSKRITAAEMVTHPFLREECTVSQPVLKKQRIAP